MSHSARQGLAWVVAFGMSGAIFGGANLWISRLLPENDHKAQHSHTERPGDSTAEEHHSDHHTASVEASHEEETAHDEVAHHVSSAHQADHLTTESHETNEKPDGKPATHVAETKPAQASHHHPAWSYLKNDAAGPAHWAELSENFFQCEKGLEQSPIDIRNETFSAHAPKLEWHYGTSKLELENNGHTVQAKILDGTHSLTIDGEKYHLAQFHFHSPSEHRFAGTPSDIEVHFVHRNASGQLAVVGAMINESSTLENKAFKPIWESLPRVLHSFSNHQPSVNLASILPQAKVYAHYKGSLTTPPCLEGVRWFVLKAPMAMSSGQIEMYSSIFQGPTNRPVQPVQGRDVISNDPPELAH